MPIREYKPKPNYQRWGGVPSPFTVHVHPYPTRFHGPIYTRPSFDFPYRQDVLVNFKPDDFAPAAYARYPFKHDAVQVHPLRGLGQLSMSAEDQARLKQCSADCDAQYGIPSGHPDPFQLTACFAQCDVATPPTITAPGGQTYTPPPITPATLQLPTAQPVPASTPAPAPTAAAKPAMSKAAVMVAGGAALVAAGGLYYWYRKKRKG